MPAVVAHSNLGARHYATHAQYRQRSRSDTEQGGRIVQVDQLIFGPWRIDSCESCEASSGGYLVERQRARIPARRMSERCRQSQELHYIMSTARKVKRRFSTQTGVLNCCTVLPEVSSRACGRLGCKRFVLVATWRLRRNRRSGRFLLL